MTTDVVLSQPPRGIVASLYSPDNQDYELLPVVAIVAQRIDGEWSFDYLVPSVDRAYPDGLMTSRTLEAYGHVRLVQADPTPAPIAG
jgi:hypothetical protein